MLKKKKRGSSLMLVIVIFAILSILGTSVLAMTSSDYYRRITETKKLQNLYGAESGLDTSYNILAKNFEAAVVYANKAVIYELDNNPSVSSMSKDEISKLKKNTFKEKFNNYIDVTTKECVENSLVITVKKYTDDIKLDSLLDASKNPNAENSGKLEIAKVGVVTGTDINVTVDPNKKNADNTINVKDNDEFSIDISSKFTPNTEEPRKVSANYKISVPEYGFNVEYDDIEMPIHPILNKTIVADGDMTIAKNTNITGNIFIQGNDTGFTGNYTYDKYKGGIEVIGTGIGETQKTSFNLDGDVVTTRSLKIKEYVDASVKGNIYALNIALGKTSDTDTVMNFSSTLNNYEKDSNDGVFLSNDLAINGDDIKVSVNNFYGINDINNNTGSSLTGEQQKIVESSSIILNANNAATLNIDKKAYVCGTAFINNSGAEKYQTGESVAIKGNYIAYSDTLDKSNTQLEYYNPLQLISKIDGEPVTTLEKAEHFAEYWKNNQDKLNNYVSVKLPTDTYTVGAYITKDNENQNVVKNSNNISAEVEKDEINPLRRTYMNELYYMGFSSGFGQDINKLHEKFPFEAEYKANVKSEILFDNLTNKNEIDYQGNRIVFNKDENRNVVIKGSALNNVFSELNGLIITKGNVIITGKVNYTGAIFAGGNVTFSDNYIENEDDIIVEGDERDVSANSSYNNKSVIIQEDTELVKKIIAKNYNNLKTVINTDGRSFPIEKFEVAHTDITDANSLLALKDYIEKGAWKIESAN